MAMRVSGLNSGLDTDAIVQELVSAYSKKTEKYEKEQTKLGWKQEIWKELNTKVNSLYKKVGDMRYSSSYSLMKTSSSDTTKATVSAGSTAVIGTQKLHILSTAQSAYLTGGKLSLRKSVTTQDADGNDVTKLETVEGKVTADTKMSELGFSGEKSTLRLETKDEDGKAVVKDIQLTKDSTVKDVVTQLKDAGLNASFDESNGRIFLSSKTTGENSDFTLSAVTTKSVVKKDDDGNIVKDDNGNPVMEDVELSDEEKANSKQLLGFLGLDTSADTQGEKAVKLDGSDATIVLNGVAYTSTTNNFSINGLNISANAVTEDTEDLKTDGKLDLSKLDVSKLKDENAITITTSTDTQGIYDKIKEFLTNYNSIINEITKLYNADSARDYEPLTDDEKDAMSDTEIEKWETKIKDSLLRRDNSLGTIMNSMMTAMSGGITINGKDYALSSFGIRTLGYLNAVENEQNAYHIDGDEDDENTSGNEDKLMAAINEDPETVVEFMKQLSTNLYKAMDKQMQSSELRSRYSIYNDKELQKQYTNYTKTIAEWEEKVSDKEEYYYKQFSGMETALAKLQSQTSSLTGLLGS